MALGRSTDLSVDINGDPTGIERAMKSAENATVRAQTAAQRYDADLRKLESDLMKLEKSLDDDVAAALDRQHDAMDKAGKGALVFGGALAGALALAGREAMNWESSWAGVTKTVDGTEAELATLEAQLRGLAKVLPATHTEIAAVAEAAGQLGIAREAIAGFTRTMVDLGETTDLTADEAATSIAQFMNVMRTAPEDADRIGAALVDLGNNGASTESQIMSMAQRLSGAGALIGASEADVLALASAMADLGIESELGGGAMSRTLTKMYAAVQSGGPALEGFAHVAGMSAQTFAEAWRADPVRAVDAFVQGLARIKTEGGDVVGALDDVKIKGTQDLSVLLRLTGAGDRLTTSLGRSADAWEDNNALLEEARKRYQTTEAQAQIAMNTIRDGAIDIGQNVLPVFAWVAETIANLGSAFGDLPGPVKTTVTVVAALAAAAALAGGAFLVAVPKVAAFKAAVDGLQAGALKTAGTRLMGLASFLAGPWGVALGAATVAVGFFAAQHGEAVRMADALRQTLDEQTGALTENSRAWAKSELLESGAYDAAHELGISLETVTDAALGNADAMEKLRDAVWEAREAGQGGLATDLMRDVLHVRDAVDEGTTAWQYYQAAGDGATGAQEDTTQAWKDGANAAGDLSEEVKTLGEDLATLAESFLTNREAQRAVREQLRGVKDRVKELREEYGPLRDAQGQLNDAYQRGTKGGDALAEVLDGVAESMLKQLEAAEKNGAGQGQLMRLHRESRAELRRVAEDLGLGEKAAARYVREILGTPKMVRTRFEQQGLQEALAMTLELRQAALEAEGSYNITFRYLTTGKVPAHGSVMGARAFGGPVFGDKPYLVGENGPEIFSPASSGHITPAHIAGPLLDDVRYGSGAAGGPGGGVDYERLAAVLERARPLYGQVTIQPHNYNEFRRQQDEDHRRAASDGIRTVAR